MSLTNYIIFYLHMFFYEIGMIGMINSLPSVPFLQIPMPLVPHMTIPVHRRTVKLVKGHVASLSIQAINQRLLQFPWGPYPTVKYEGTREAAELQKGLAGINWRQTAITQFFKPVDRKRTTRKIRVWTDVAHEVSPTTTQNKLKKRNNKNRTDSNMIIKNKNIRIEHIFENVISGGIVYWEFKAG